jgi:hypothetical protein
MNSVSRTFKYARDGGSTSYTGKFEITIEELETGYRCGKICYEDGRIFIGKYYQDASGKTKMVEGRYTSKCGKVTQLGRFWENKLSDGIIVEDGKIDGRVLPYD